MSIVTWMTFWLPGKAEHLENLDAVLGRLEQFGLHAEKGKCDFFKESLEYLGHLIDAEGLHKSPQKVHAIVNAPIPSNITQLRSFLGLLNYYGRFIPNLANINLWHWCRHFPHDTQR